MPRDVLVAVVQDACVTVELDDATKLPSAVAKMMRVLGAVPQMEHFISLCCESVFRHGRSFLPPHVEHTPHGVPEVLHHWLKLLGRLTDLEEMQRGVAAHLACQPRGRPAPDGPAATVYAVKRLVEAERAALAAGETIAAAQELMQDPQQLLHRLVARFQELFDCPKLESVLTCMNQVKLTVAPRTHVFPGASIMFLSLVLQASKNAEQNSFVSFRLCERCRFFAQSRLADTF
jgi:hypothetical protein